MELSNISDLLGYAAAGLVLVAFSLRSITALRSAAIASNVMFIAYAATAHLMPVLILHGLLLPLNFWRLRQDLTSNPGAREPLLKKRSRNNRSSPACCAVLAPIPGQLQEVGHVGPCAVRT